MNTTYAFCFLLRNFRELAVTSVRQQEKETTSSQGKRGPTATSTFSRVNSFRKKAPVSVSSLHFYALSTNSFYCILGLILPAWMGSQECPQIIFFLVLVKDAMRLDPDRAQKQSKVAAMLPETTVWLQYNSRQWTHRCPGNSVIIQLCWQTAPFKLAPFN